MARATASALITHRRPPMVYAPRRKLGEEHDYPEVFFGFPSCRTEGFFRFCHASRTCLKLR